MVSRLYPKGTKLVCRSCGQAIYELKESVVTDGVVKYYLLRGLNGIPDPGPKDKVACPICLFGQTFATSVFTFQTPNDEPPMMIEEDYLEGPVEEPKRNPFPKLINFLFATFLALSGVIWAIHLVQFLAGKPISKESIIMSFILSITLCLLLAFKHVREFYKKEE